MSFDQMREGNCSRVTRAALKAPNPYSHGAAPAMDSREQNFESNAGVDADFEGDPFA